MRVRELLTEARTHSEVQASSKKQLLDQVAQLAAAGCDSLNEQEVFDALVAREKLGSTGIGEGIAIPHCRLQGCESPVSALLHLDAPIDFDAIDGAPVDLLFVLLVPKAATDAHLELLRQIASMLDRKEVRDRLRSANSNEALYQVVLDEQSGQ